jgi:hypothetical protein
MPSLAGAGLVVSAGGVQLASAAATASSQPTTGAFTAGLRGRSRTIRAMQGLETWVINLDRAPERVSPEHRDQQRHDDDDCRVARLRRATHRKDDQPA